MNQRSRDRSRDPAMPFDQLVECRNSRRIAQHYGDLTATGNAGGLALGAGLGFHSVHRRGREDFAAIRSKHGAGLRFADVERTAVAGDIAPAGRSLFYGAGDYRSGEAGRVELRANVHGLLQSGPIPLMCESYAVTSDVSTGISV